MTATQTDPFLPQRMSALDRANEIRLARAALRKRIYAGEITTARVLLECPPEANTWPVADLIMAQRRWGRSRTLKLLSREHIIETKPVGALTDRQRGRLVDLLGERTAGDDGGTER
jgi:hypothetical protein